MEGLECFLKTFDGITVHNTIVAHRAHNGGFDDSDLYKLPLNDLPGKDIVIFFWQMGV